MANPLVNLSRKKPLTKEDLDDGLNFLPIPDDILQLQVDTLNVMEGRVDLSSFSPEYQQKIKDYYRFSAHKTNTSNYRVASRTFHTMEIV